MCLAKFYVCIYLFLQNVKKSSSNLAKCLRRTSGSTISADGASWVASANIAFNSSYWMSRWFEDMDFILIFFSLKMKLLLTLLSPLRSNMGGQMFRKLHVVTEKMNFILVQLNQNAVLTSCLNWVKIHWKLTIEKKSHKLKIQFSNSHKSLLKFAHSLLVASAWNSLHLAW